MKGRVPEQNKKAENKIIEMINNATWMNAHLLPHDEAVFEVGFIVCWTATTSLIISNY